MILVAGKAVVVQEIVTMAGKVAGVVVVVVAGEAAEMEGGEEEIEKSIGVE